jgi:hypothetical protein
MYNFIIKNNKLITLYSISNIILLKIIQKKNKNKNTKRYPIIR